MSRRFPTDPSTEVYAALIPSCTSLEWTASRCTAPDTAARSIINRSRSPANLGLQAQPACEQHDHGVIVTRIVKCTFVRQLAAIRCNSMKLSEQDQPA